MQTFSQSAIINLFGSYKQKISSAVHACFYWVYFSQARSGDTSLQTLLACSNFVGHDSFLTLRLPSHTKSYFRLQNFHQCMPNEIFVVQLVNTPFLHLVWTNLYKNCIVIFISFINLSTFYAAKALDIFIV